MIEHVANDLPVIAAAAGGTGEVGVGVSSFADFPVGAHGSSTDTPYTLGARISTEIAAAAEILRTVPAGFGSDGPESGVESLHQIATGAGVTWTSGGVTGSVPPMDCAVGFDRSRGHGTRGGVCFREQAQPVVLHLTDAVSHDGSVYRGEGSVPGAALVTPTLRELRDLGVRVVGLWASAVLPPEGTLSDPLYPAGMALGTGSAVPTCAFDGTDARDRGVCMPGECCTGSGEVGTAPTADGRCPLSFVLSHDAPETAERAGVALDLLERFIPRRVTVEVHDGAGDAVDATCFVDSIEVTDLTGPGDGCRPEPARRDTDGDGRGDAVESAVEGARMTFTVRLRDRDGSGAPCAPSGTYLLHLRAVADGRYPQAARDVRVTVP